MPFVPLVVKRYKVEILLCLVDALRYLLHEVRSRQQFACCVEEGHCSIDAYANVYIVVFGNVYDISHIFECVPRRQTEHQR